MCWGNVTIADSATEAAEKSGRHFLLLQMPCGSFGRHLQASLESAGYRCTRIVFNGGDLVNSLGQNVVRYVQSTADWPIWIENFATKNKVTDLICYGDCRYYHCVAIDQLRPLGIRVRVLEEGYLRPNWITCEHNGVNGFSTLTAVDIEALPANPGMPKERELKSSYNHYLLAGFIYYLFQFLLHPAFPNYVSHRELPVYLEAALWLRRWFTWPYRRLQSRRISNRIAKLGRPVHLVLLQLNGDSQIKVHSDFASVADFARFCIAEFSASDLSDSLLVFKNHPLDNGVISLGKVIRHEAEQVGLGGQVLFVDGGNLVSLLERSVSVVSINSTACHQSLRRGIPTLLLGRTVFNHPLIASRMRMRDFFRLRPIKQRAHYEKLVSFMIETSQVNGGYYSREGQAILIPALIASLVKGGVDLPHPQEQKAADSLPEPVAECIA